MFLQKKFRHRAKDVTASYLVQNLKEKTMQRSV